MFFRLDWRNLTSLLLLFLLLFSGLLHDSLLKQTSPMSLDELACLCELHHLRILLICLLLHDCCNFVTLFLFFKFNFVLFFNLVQIWNCIFIFSQGLSIVNCLSSNISIIYLNWVDKIIWGFLEVLSEI